MTNITYTLSATYNGQEAYLGHFDTTAEVQEIGLAEAEEAIEGEIEFNGIVETISENMEVHYG